MSLQTEYIEVARPPNAEDCTREDALQAADFVLHHIQITPDSLLADHFHPQSFDTLFGFLDMLHAPPPPACHPALNYANIASYCTALDAEITRLKHPATTTSAPRC